MNDYLKDGFIDEVKGSLNRGGGGDKNIIEKVKVNGVEQTVDSNKEVNIPVPTKTSELENDSDYKTADDVTTKVTEEVAKIVANAPEDFDTLKEMSDWIASHENDASAMNSAIQANKTDIAVLQTGKADIESVDGVNRNLDTLEFGEVAGGKNLQNVNSIVVKKEDVYITDYLLPIGTYTISFVSDTSGSVDFYSKELSSGVSGGGGCKIIANQRVSKTFTVNSPTRLCSYSTVTATLTEIQIEEGTTATPYEPYIPSVKMIAEEVNQQNASLEVLGKCKNMLKPTLGTTTVNGVTCTDNGDGTYTLNGTASSSAVFPLLSSSFYNMTQYNGKFMVGCPSGGSKTEYGLVLSGDSSTPSIWDIGNGIELNISDSGRYRLVIYIASGVTISNLVFKPMITTNLNATYDDFVPYTGDGNTLTADVADLKDALNDALNDVEFLGWSVPSECHIRNYVDSDGVFHQRVGRVDLGSLKWNYNSDYKTFVCDIKNNKSIYAPNIKIVGKDYTKSVSYYTYFVDKNYGFGGDYAQQFIVKDLDYTDATAFKNAMQGVYLYYELATEKTIKVGSESVSECVTKEYMQNYSGGIVYGQNSSGTGMFVIPLTRYIATSLDGVTNWEVDWECNLDSILDSDEIILGITYGNGKFVCFTNKGFVLCSSDTVNWTKTRGVIM